jgi:hypothetical protein
MYDVQTEMPTEGAFVMLYVHRGRPWAIDFKIEDGVLHRYQENTDSWEWEAIDWVDETITDRMYITLEE